MNFLRRFWNPLINFFLNFLNSYTGVSIKFQIDFYTLSGCLPVKCDSLKGARTFFYRARLWKQISLSNPFFYIQWKVMNIKLIFTQCWNGLLGYGASETEH